MPNEANSVALNALEDAAAFFDWFAAEECEAEEDDPLCGRPACHESGCVSMKRAQCHWALAAIRAIDLTKPVGE